MDMLGGSPQPDRLPDLRSLHRFGRFSKRVWLCSAATPVHLMRRTADLQARREKEILFQRANGPPGRAYAALGLNLWVVLRGWWPVTRGRHVDRCPGCGQDPQTALLEKPERVWMQCRDACRALCGGQASAVAMTKEEERELREQLARLQQEHRDLDAAISALQHSPGSDLLQVQRLKKRKLVLRDRISYIEDQLTPDIIA